MNEFEARLRCFELAAGQTFIKNVRNEEKVDTIIENAAKIWAFVGGKCEPAPFVVEEERKRAQQDAARRQGIA